MRTLLAILAFFLFNYLRPLNVSEVMRFCYTPRMRLAIAVIVAILVGTLFAAAQTSQVKAAPAKPLWIQADLIFLNGGIYTGEGFAQDHPQTVQALAIYDGKILAAGTNQEILRHKGPHTRVRDLDTAKTGVYLFPGFNDAHTHLGEGASDKMNLDLEGTRSLGEMLNEIGSFARGLPPGHWITGGRWDQTLWAEKTLPTREQLDRVTGDHPAFLSRVDGHIAIANSAALKAAGITGETTLPEGGAIDLDKNGEPTGIVRESAQELVDKVIPPPTMAERRRGIELAIAEALANGVTSAQDFSDWQDFLVYEQLENEKKLNMRIAEWIPFREPLADEEQQRAHHRSDDLMLHTTMLKGFMDGSLGSRTAAMKKPYADDPGNTGLPQFTQAELNQMAVERAQAGFQLGFHAIGDRAISMALDAIQQAELARYHVGDLQQLYDLLGPAPCWRADQPYEIWDEKFKVPCGQTSEPSKPAPEPASQGLKLSAGVAVIGPRHRIEHAQVVDPADIPRFRELGVIASMQPCHLLTDMNWAEARLGPKRAAYSYAWKSFLDAGVPLAFGTDYPVEPISPYRGLYAAVTRMNEQGTKSYFPEQKITRGQALAAYTQGSAYAEFAEKTKGKLLSGYDADFILVDRNLFTVTPQDLLHARTLETFVAGQQVFLANVRIR
jgi:predicted amidohydrolase YtcJ